MEKANYSQLELFPQSGDSGSAVSARAHHSFLRCVWSYEKTILVIIALIITGIVSFSFGVEKGKKLVSAEESSAPVAKQIISAPLSPSQPLAKEDISSVKKIQNLPVLEKREATKNPQVKEFIESYTVQVASFQARDHATREIVLLKGKGYSPLLLSKKGYAIVCVGNFTNPGAAKSMLADLKRQYRDCFVRKL